MPVLLGQRWRRQPQVAVGIDWSNPLSRRLVLAALPVGNQWRELLTEQLTPNTNTFRQRATIDGNNAVATSLISATTGTGNKFTDPTGFDKVAGPLSIFAEGSLEINAADRLSVVRSDETANGNGYALSFDDQAFGPDDFSVYVNNSIHAASTTGALGTNSELFTHRVMVTEDGTNTRAYAKRQLNNTVASTALPNADATRRTAICASRASAVYGAPNGASCALALAWDRVLSLEEYQALYDNPWQIFRPQQRRIYVNVAAAAGSVLSAPGDSTATFTGKAIANGVLNAAGDATATFTGKAITNGVLSAAGDATAALVGKALANGVLSGAGDATASFTGKALASGVLSGAGDATASFVGRANAAAVWAAAADSTGSFVGTTGGNALSAAGDSSAIFVGAELAAAVLAAAGDATAAFISLAIGGEQPETRGYRGKRRLARGLRDDADAETVRKHYDLVELKKKQAKEKREKAGTEARGARPEPTRPAASEAPTEAPAPSAPVETEAQRLDAVKAEFETLRAEMLAAREDAEILALMAIAIAAENH